MKITFEGNVQEMAALAAAMLEGVQAKAVEGENNANASECIREALRCEGMQDEAQRVSEFFMEQQRMEKEVARQLKEKGYKIKEHLRF